MRHCCSSRFPVQKVTDLQAHLASMHAVYLLPRSRGRQALMDISNASPAASADACSAAVSETAVHHQRFKRLQQLEETLADHASLQKRFAQQQEVLAAYKASNRKHASLCARYQKLASEERHVALQRDQLSAANAHYRTQLQTAGKKVERSTAKVAFLESFPHVELGRRGSEHEGKPVLVVPGRDVELQTIDLPLIMVTRQRTDAAGELCGGKQFSAWLLLLCAELAAIASVAYEKTAVCVDRSLQRARIGRLSECASTQHVHLHQADRPVSEGL